VDVEAARHDLATALAAAEGARGRDAGLRAARQVVIERCADALGPGASASLSLAGAVRLAADAPQPARRDCAVLMVHALSVPGLVPAAAAGDGCRLVEQGLRGALLRCGYPFSGSIEERQRVLERLHATIGELLQPLEPTFPNWPGLHAG